MAYFIKNNKRKFLSIFGVAMAILLFVESSSVVMAKTVTGVMNVSGCKYGRYLYYSYNSGGTRDGIIRFDSKTGKKKTIIRNDMSDSSWTNGYRNLVVKGQYIYAVWDKFSGTGGDLEYIYRISKDGSSKKKLACGSSMVIVGNRIYYEKCKFVDDGYGGYTKEVGRASMKLDGSDKRSEKENDFLWEKPAGEVFVPITGEVTDGLVVGKYTYYSSENGKKLFCRSKAGMKKVVFQADGKFQLCEIEIYGNMILIECQNISAHKGSLYYIDSLGSGKQMLKEWNLAE